MLYSNPLDYPSDDWLTELTILAKPSSLALPLDYPCYPWMLCSDPLDYSSDGWLTELTILAKPSSLALLLDYPKTRSLSDRTCDAFGGTHCDLRSFTQPQQKNLTRPGSLTPEQPGRWSSGTVRITILFHRADTYC